MSNAGRAAILVVDDIREKHLAYEVALEELDQNMVAAASGEEALQLLLEREFAVILLDVNMPGMSGLQTAALIRQRKKSRHTPIIFVTAFADDVQTIEGYALGAVDYILTPIVPEILRAKVRFVELYRCAGVPPDARSSSVADAMPSSSDGRAAAPEARAQQGEERLTILVQELAHRVKNLLSVFQSITSRTLTGGRTTAEAREVLIGRLQSLGHAHELLTEAYWRGAELRDVVKAEIAGFSERVRISGPAVGLSPSGVQTFALIVHELCTNAAKYGRCRTRAARCRPNGRQWAIAQRLHTSEGARGLRSAALHEGFGLSLTPRWKQPGVRAHHRLRTLGLP
jgi:CheY-like chemotaxis protein